MKKALSLMLATMMLVSLFAVNASAMIGFTYTEVEGAQDEIVMVEQDFSDAEKEDYTSSGGYYSNSTVENGCVTMSTKDSGAILHTSSWTPITEEKWTLEFDVKRNSEMTNTQYYGVIVGCEKAAYADDADKIAKSLNKYAIYLPLQDKEKDTWYTYRITFDETKGSDWWTTLLTIISSAEYKKAGDTEWTPITVSANYNWAITGNQARPIAVSNYVGFGETSFMFRSMTGTSDATELANANFSMDNFKAYVPAVEGEEVEKNYPLASGTIHLTKEVANVPDAKNYTSSAPTSVDNLYTTNTSAVEEGKTRSYTVTFDAKNTVQGMPLFVHIGGNYGVSGTVICPTEVIGNDWYSYKLVATEIMGSASLSTSVYRKPLGSDEAYVKMSAPWKTEYVSGNEFISHDSYSNKTNSVRISYDHRTEMAAAPGCDLTATVWEVKNLQVTSEAVVAGFANLADGTIFVDADIKAATGNAFVALAVKNGNTMVDVDFVNIAGGDGALDLTADYAEGNTANLLIWNAADNAPLVQPINVVSALSE